MADLPILDIADTNERRLLKQRLRNRKWRAANPDLNQQAIEKGKQKEKENRRELKQLRQEVTELRALLRDILAIFDQPQTITDTVQ